MLAAMKKHQKTKTPKFVQKPASGPKPDEKKKPGLPSKESVEPLLTDAMMSYLKDWAGYVSSDGSWTDLELENKGKCKLFQVEGFGSLESFVVKLNSHRKALHTVLKKKPRNPGGSDLTKWKSDSLWAILNVITRRRVAVAIFD